MSLGTRMATTALTLLTNYGEAVSFTRVVEGAYNVATSTTAAGTTTNFSGYGAPLNYTKQEIDGDNVKDTDILLIVNQVSSVPVPGDVVTINSIDYRVMNVDRTRANGVDVIFTLQLRV